jgi:hypothetical protein
MLTPSTITDTFNESLKEVAHYQVWEKTRGYKMEPTIVSKISIKSIGANPKQAIKELKNAPVVLAHIYGRAGDTKVVENKEAGTTSDALLGQFEAVNVETGELYRSAKLFLPNIAQQLVVAEVKRLLAEGGADVDFAFEIISVPSTKSAVGYEYQVKSLLKPNAADPLEQMRLKIAELRKELPAANVEKESTTTHPTSSKAAASKK